MGMRMRLRRAGSEMIYTHLLEGKTPCRPLDTKPGGLVEILTAAGNLVTVPGAWVTPLFGVNSPQHDPTGAPASRPGAGTAEEQPV